MTALDAGIVLGLVLLAAGGYRQGLLRGLLRLATLLTIAAAAAVLSLGLNTGGSGRLGGAAGPLGRLGSEVLASGRLGSEVLASVAGLLLRAGLLFGGVVVIVATAAWLLDRLVPPSLHRSPLNKWLGIVPALAVGSFVLALALGTAHRVAFGEEWQRYLADGIVSGPLTRPLNWLECNLLAWPP